jgi:hypothetical protein
MKDEYWRLLAVSVVVGMMAVLLCLPARSQTVLGQALEQTTDHNPLQ